MNTFTVTIKTIRELPWVRGLIASAVNSANDSSYRGCYFVPPITDWTVKEEYDPTTGSNDAQL